MMDDQELSLILDDWFSEGPTEMPDRVVDVVAIGVSRQRQRPVWRFRRKERPVTTYLKPFAAIAAVLIIAVIGYNLLPRDGGHVGGPAATATPGPTNETVVSPSPKANTMKAGTMESSDSPAGTALAYFAAEVSRSSGGRLAVDVTYESASALTGGGEHDLVTRTKGGEFDFAIVPTRAWQAEGITSFDATMSPMLIDSDGLASAVAQDPIAATMLGGLSATDLTGLAMWPEDLRHPISFGGPFLTPASFKGVGIRAIPSDVTSSLISTFGGHTVDLGGDDLVTAISDHSVGGAESGFQNQVSLPVHGTFTGNVTFYPRMDVLTIGRATMTGLTPEDRDVILAAARATTRHVAVTNIDDATGARAYCADGGKVVLASPDQIAAFAAAAKPVADSLLADPLTKTVVTRIAQMKASLPPSTTVLACGS